MYQIEDLFAKLAPVCGTEKMNKLWLVYQTETDYHRRRQIEGIVHSLASKHLDETYSRTRILLPPPELPSQPGINLGSVRYGDDSVGDFIIPLSDLPLHMGIYGSSGAGKTCTSFVLMSELLNAGVNFCLMDWKRQARHILSTQPAAGHEIQVYTVGRDVNPFSFDPFVPPKGTTEENWNRKLCEILSESHFLGYGARYAIGLALESASERSMKGLFQALTRMKATGRKRQWIDSSIRAVGDLTMGSTAALFSGDAQHKLSDILNNNCIFELDALSDDAKRFFVHVFLAYIHEELLNSEERDVLKNVIMIEEAHHVLKRSSNYEEKESTANVMFRQLRELGVALVVLDQQPGQISKTVLNNTATSIFLRLKHSDDVRAAADSLLLKPEQRDYLGRLQTGWAIARTATSPSPFLVKIPQIEIDKSKVTDDFLKAKRSPNSPSTPDIPSPHADRTEIQAPLPDENKGKGDILGPTETSFLRDVIANSLSGVAERYRRLGLSAGKGNDIKQELLGADMITERAVPNGNGTTKILELTEKGRLLIGASDGSYHADANGRLGSPEHRFWVDRISSDLEQEGFSTSKEFQLDNGHFVDIVAQRDGKRIAVEIETGKSNFLGNIEKDITDPSINKIVVVGTSKKQRDRIIRQLRKDSAAHERQSSGNNA